MADNKYQRGLLFLEGMESQDSLEEQEEGLPAEVEPAIEGEVSVIREPIEVSDFQEHQFSLPLIARLLEDLNIKFCGFENPSLIEKFRIFHGDNSNIYDLGAWQTVEKHNQNLFTGMYQFWCQKI